uniref:Uncharacterized protein n=1 Tax=Anguilla anguilla TaxID=7936 RepID=A0A0E9TUU1_ANGAN
MRWQDGAWARWTERGPPLQVRHRLPRRATLVLGQRGSTEFRLQQ